MSSFVEAFKDLIVEDTGWTDAPTSIHSRGLHDYQRDVQFKQVPSSEELGQVIKWLTENQCPGWTGVHARSLTQTPPTYRFTTTLDSSD